MYNIYRMPYCKQRNLLYLHIPKTGGTSIAQALGLKVPSDQYDPVRFYGIRDDGLILHTLPLCLFYLWRLLTPTELTAATIFTVVRNPYDRAVSDYCWNKRKQPSFVDYLKLCRATLNRGQPVELLWYNEELVANHFLPQTFFTNFEHRTVDHVLKFENLEEDFKKLFPDLKLPHLNGQEQRGDDIDRLDKQIAAEHGIQDGYKRGGPAYGILEAKKPLENYYKDPEAIELVQELYQEDFECFNYSTEPPIQEVDND